MWDAEGLASANGLRFWPEDAGQMRAGKASIGQSLEVLDADFRSDMRRAGLCPSLELLGSGLDQVAIAEGVVVHHGLVNK